MLPLFHNRQDPGGDGTLSSRPDPLTSIPGFSTTVTEGFIAETGADMSVFPTPQQLASWAATSPRTSPPAGLSPPKSGPGTTISKAPWASQPCPRCGLTAPIIRQIPAHASRRGPVKALVAIEPPCSPRPGTCSSRRTPPGPGSRLVHTTSTGRVQGPRNRTTRIPGLQSHHRTTHANRIMPDPTEDAPQHQPQSLCPAEPTSFSCQTS
jgi:hypothetical protein